MYSYKYPAIFSAEDGGFVRTFPDVPEAITQGESIEEAMEAATDALDEAISGRINQKMTIPKSSQAKAGQYMISVPLQTALKPALYEEIAGDGSSQTAVATRLGIDEKEVRRLLNPYGPTKLPRIEETLRRAGLRTTVTIESASEVLHVS